MNNKSYRYCLKSTCSNKYKSVTVNPILYCPECIKESRAIMMVAQQRNQHQSLSGPRANGKASSA